MYYCTILYKVCRDKCRKYCQAGQMTDTQKSVLCSDMGYLIAGRWAQLEGEEMVQILYFKFKIIDVCTRFY